MVQLPDPELNTGLLCFIAYRAMETRVLDAIHAAGFDDITSAQARVFAQLAEGGSRLGELAERARISKQTAVFLVDQLEDAGYVRRTPDPSDRRAKLVRVAPRGERAAAVARAAELEVEADWSAHLGPRQTEQLRRALTRLRELVDPYR